MYFRASGVVSGPLRHLWGRFRCAAAQNKRGGPCEAFLFYLRRIITLIYSYMYISIYIYIYVGLPLPPAALAVRVSCACCALAAVQHCSLLPLSAFLFFRFGFHAFLNFLIAVVFSFFPACSLFLCLVGLQNILFVAAFLLPLCLPFFSAGRATGTSGLQFVWLCR